MNGQVMHGAVMLVSEATAMFHFKLNYLLIDRDPLGHCQVIADNVGDNVGDIAGMGSDLFGSFAESTCAALVISSLSSFGTAHNFTAMLFPLYISAAGIFVCLFTTFFATDIVKVNLKKEIEPSLKLQLIISTALMTPVILLVAWLTLPSEFTITVIGSAPKLVKWWYDLVLENLKHAQ